MSDALRSRAARALLALGCLVPALAASAASFEDDVNAIAARYSARAAAPDAKQATLEGRLGDANRMLLELVPDDRKTAADWFVVGNMLYRADPEASDRALLKAEAMRPDEPLILYERGMHEHRARHCAAALGYYDRFHAAAARPLPGAGWAYSAQCHLVLGEPDKALADWSRADFGHYHIAIEEAMYEIFATRNSDRERAALVAAASPAKPEASCDLMELDTHWERDWWNMAARRDYLDEDTRRARALLAADAPALREFELCHEAAEASADKVFVQRLVEAHLWGDKPALPRSPRLAYMATRALVATKTATPADVLAAWGDALAARLAATPDDRTTLELMAYLYVSVGDKVRLEEADRQGWKRLHLRPFAESWVSGRIREDKLTTADIEAAAADFPDSALIAWARMRLLPEGPARQRALVAYVAATFANVANQWPRGARLSDAMAALARPDARP